MAASVDPKPIDQYTVGWISALPLERAAATAMLDEIHPRPRDFKQPSTDPNAYSYGHIGSHSIVIASLPAGVYGLTAASATALHMVSTFPRLRVGLLVGIAAGVPAPGRDIRLGDIIVAQTNGTSAGVLQYDLRKAMPGGQFERKGSLNNPPAILSHAVAQLQEEHERMDSSVPRYLTEMIQRNPKMAHQYSHQGAENDRLFVDDYEHVSGTNCSHCDASRVVSRPDRRSNQPEIHYGIIGSGNTLVKDAKERNTILECVGEECICLEMEAAGLVNHFPCLVIRGICDYADSHKNDNWQRYAAATAAAYAKELLQLVPEGDMDELPRISDATADDVKALSQVTRPERLPNDSATVVFSGAVHAGRDNTVIGTLRSRDGNVRVGGGS